MFCDPWELSIKRNGIDAGRMSKADELPVSPAKDRDPLYRRGGIVQAGTTPTTGLEINHNEAKPDAYIRYRKARNDTNDQGVEKWPAGRIE